MMLTVSLAVCVLFLVQTHAIYTSDYYTAAVFEHVKLDNVRDRPSSILANLEAFHQAAVNAAALGADIIVFPESGIMPSIQKLKYYEEIPDPKNSSSNRPCQQSSRGVHNNGTNSTALTRLSCIAREAGIYVVANIGEKAPCSPLNDTRCPKDTKVLFYNSDVVFDGNGTLIARHRKRFPFFEAGISRPTKPEYTVFNTSFGSFGVIICFDTVFVEAVELVEKYHVENMIISTWWFDELPIMSALEYFQGWALGNKVNALVADIHKPSSGSIGSLIVSGTHGALNYTFKPTRVSSELLIAKVPRRQSYTPEIIPISNVPPALDGYKYTNTDMRNFTRVGLQNTTGRLQACNNGLCCVLNYTSKTEPRNFHLVAFNGIRNVRNRYFFCQEICALVLCSNGTNCTAFPPQSEVIFQSVSLSGNIVTKHQYPSVVASDLRLVPKSNWDFSLGKLSLHPGSVRLPLLAFGIQGRCYDRDPPFPNS